MLQHKKNKSAPVPVLVHTAGITIGFTGAEAERLMLYTGKTVSEIINTYTMKELLQVSAYLTFIQNI